MMSGMAWDIIGMIAVGMFLVASLGFVGVNGWRQRSQHQATIVGARREYLAYLAELRTTVRQAARQQRRNAEWNNPDPRSLPVIAEERSRVWERQPDHADFLHVRVGQSVTLKADIYGSSVTYHGTVEGFSGGSGAAFAAIPAQNATGNWIKVVQRVPVRIKLDPKDLAAKPLKVGLSMTVKIDTRGNS